MDEENIIEIPAREIDNPPPEEEWGTEMAEYRGEVDEYRGKVFKLFGMVDQNVAVDEWLSTVDWPYIAQCIEKKDNGNTTIEILELKPREKEAK